MFEGTVTLTWLNNVLFIIGTAWVAASNFISLALFFIREYTKSSLYFSVGSIELICWLVVANPFIWATLPMVDPILTNSVEPSFKILPFLNPFSDNVVIVFST